MKATNIITKSIGAKLIALFLIASIIPLGIISYISYHNSYKALVQSVEDAVISTTSSRANHVEDFLAVNLDFIKTVSSFNMIQENLNNIEIGKDVKQSVEILENALEEFNANSNVFYRAKILNTNGIIVATTKSVLNDAGDNKSETDYFKNGLTGDFISEPYISPELKVANIAYSCPIFAPNSKKIIGVLVIHQGLDGKLNSGKNTGTGIGVENITIHPEGMGETGETYLINKSGLIITHSRFDEDVFLKSRLNESILNNLISDNYKIIYNDYRGIPVFGYAKQIGGTNWYLIGEFSQSEILMPIVKLRNQMLVFSLIILLLVIVLAFFISRYFTNPILKLNSALKKMALGELDSPIEINMKDEIGELAESFKIMQGNLNKKAQVAKEIANGNLKVDFELLSEKDTLGISLKTMAGKLLLQLSEIGESINVLSASTSEIMASITQLASTSVESATAVSETTTTVEEVKQTAEVSNFKAKEVSEKAAILENISAKGNKAIENTVEGMYIIQKQMELIANIVVRLSEQSQTISEITLSVSELADRSNLLAVNAAIEAAKAGEQGKGFGVVAQEIKNMAERSKEASSQIRNIIKDIQKSISTAVMTTEEGSKAVADGIKLSTVSSQSIIALTKSVTDSANAALQIAASSQQQLEGVDQIAIAMENIKEASLQTSTSAQQSAQAVKDIQEMAENLKKVMTQYKM